MSVRTEPTDAALGVPSDPHPLGEGMSMSTASQNHPLKRSLTASISASLHELCLQKEKATWAPSGEALKSIFQQQKFTSLDGSQEAQGCLQSVILHDLSLTHVKSTFPVPLGAHITGVDNCTFSSTGEAFSTIVLPNAESTQAQQLQADDVGLAFEFASKFPGYTRDNIATRNVHEVPSKSFVLLPTDHPVFAAISENSEQLQLGEMSIMPEGMVKISTSLYQHVLPLVQQQVRAQVRSRDVRNYEVRLQPAEFGSWAAARQHIMGRAKRPLKAQMEAEIAAGGHESDIRTAFAKKEAELEHQIDHQPMDAHLSISISYNFLAN